MKLSSSARFGFFLIGILLVIGSQVGRAADDQTKRDAEAILSRAAGLVNLQAPGAAPFLMSATVVLREGDKSVEGVFAMAWAAPGQYRRVFRFPNFTATEVATNGALHYQRSTEALPLMIWELNQLLTFGSRYRLDTHLKVRKIQTERLGPTELTCVLTQSGLNGVKTCVDSASGEPFSIDENIDAIRLDSLRQHYEFGDYQTFDGHIFPRKMIFHGWKARTIEVQIQKLVHAASFAADEFMPPKGATEVKFCESPQTTGEVRPSTGSTIPIGFSDLEVDMYFQVTPAGGVRYAQVVYSSDASKNREVLSWFLGTHFPIKTCSGTPIPYETLFSLASGH